MDIIQLFLESIPARCHQITKHVRQNPQSDPQNNKKQLIRLFHALKTSAKMAGFDDLSSLAKLAEAASENEGNYNNIKKFALYLESAVSNPEILVQSNPQYQDILAGFKFNQSRNANSTKGDRHDYQ